jgi:hypothetical protein
MRVFLVNPSHVSFGTAVITPRWLYVLAAATPTWWGDPIVADETLEPFDASQLTAGDVVGIGIHTGKRCAATKSDGSRRARRMGGVWRHSFDAVSVRGARLEAHTRCPRRWRSHLGDRHRRLRRGNSPRVYEAGRIGGGTFKTARWDLLPKIATCGRNPDSARVPRSIAVLLGVAAQTARAPRQAAVRHVIQEAVELRRRGSGSSRSPTTISTR